VVVLPAPASAETQFTHQRPLAYDFARSRGCAVGCFRTVSDMDVATERHMDVTSESWSNLPRDLCYLVEAPIGFQKCSASSNPTKFYSCG